MTIQMLNLREVQLEELRILEAFNRFAERHGLVYTLLYGTLIGAMRHRGFIPWDDDIDVGMPRPDYQWLISHRSELESETGFELTPLRGLPLSNTLICKLVNRDIFVEERGVTGTENLWIDIFPIDSLPNDDRVSRKICSSIVRKQLLFVALTSPVSSALTMKRKIAKALLKPLGLVIKPLALARDINALAQSTQYGTTKLVGPLTWSYVGYEGRFPIEQLSHIRYVEFEDLLLPVMEDPSVNLSGTYGDYMTVPDPSKRETHSLKAWRIF